MPQTHYSRVLKPSPLPPDLGKKRGHIQSLRWKNPRTPEKGICQLKMGQGDSSRTRVDGLRVNSLAKGKRENS